MMRQCSTVQWLDGCGPTVCKMIHFILGQHAAACGLFVVMQSVLTKAQFKGPSTGSAVLKWNQSYYVMSVYYYRM